MPNCGLSNIQERILDAATNLFSTKGYNGVGTRQIANLAGVNETSIYRHYATKRDLFIATLEAQFSKVSVRAGLLSDLATAQDSRKALAAVFEAIRDIALRQPALMRLVQFGVLEFGGDLDEVYRRHVRDPLQSAANYLANWPELTEAQKFDTRITIIAFIATLVALQDFFPVLMGEQLSPTSLESASRTCANLWHNVLVGMRDESSAPPIPTSPDI